jgi:hypothetical protein
VLGIFTTIGFLDLVTLLFKEVADAKSNAGSSSITNTLFLPFIGLPHEVLGIELPYRLQHRVIAGDKFSSMLSMIRWAIARPRPVPPDVLKRMVRKS